MFTPETFLEKMPELFDKYSHEKSIPEDYLMSSAEDRWSLLQGLMDTDGTIYEGEGNRIRIDCQQEPTLIVLIHYAR